MKKVMAILLFAFLIFLPTVLAVDFVPQGNISLRGIYTIKNWSISNCVSGQHVFGITINGSWNCTADTGGAGGGNSTEEMQDAIGNSFDGTMNYSDSINKTGLNRTWLQNEGLTNRSTNWANYNGTNTSQFENSNGLLHIVESWITAFLNTWLGTKTTDNLVQGSSNKYDNTSWNQTGASTLFQEDIGSDCGTNLFAKGVDDNGALDCAAPPTNTTEEMQDAAGGAADETLNYTDASNKIGINRTWLNESGRTNSSWYWGNFRVSSGACSNVCTDADYDASDDAISDCTEVNACTIDAESMEGTDWGTMTNTYWCAYDSGSTEVDCNVVPVVDTSNTTEQMQDAVGGGVDGTMNYTDASNLLGVNRTWLGLIYQEDIGSDCSTDNYVYGVQDDGTLLCRADQVGGGGTGAPHWVDGGTYLYPNTSYADNIQVFGYINASNWLNVSITDWAAQLNNYPAACGAGTFATTISDTLTCSAPSYNTTEQMQDAVGGGIDETLNYTDASDKLGLNRTWLNATGRTNASWYWGNFRVSSGACSNVCTDADYDAADDAISDCTEVNACTIDAESVEGTDTGTLTNGYYCTYDSGSTEIDCNTQYPVASSDSTWTLHNSYPAACGTGTFPTTIGDTLTCAAPTYNTTEEMQDAAGAMATSGSGVSLTYSDGANTLTTALTSLTSNWYQNGAFNISTAGNIGINATQKLCLNAACTNYIYDNGTCTISIRGTSGTRTEVCD